MTSRIHNLTRRLVSIRGNSGETWHLPPGGALELPNAETAENDKVSKLVANGILSVQIEDNAAPVSAPIKKHK
jgi:hypothetical protein